MIGQKLLTLIALSVFFGTTVQADEVSKKFAKKAHYMVVAFDCSLIAGSYKNTEEQKRLFDAGLEAGREFLGAARAGKVKKQEFLKVIPWQVSMAMQGPSDDFILGRIFEGRADAFVSQKDRDFDGNAPVDQENNKIYGEKKFREKNCQHL